MFEKQKCRRKGHDTDPDPGDFVLYCRRCHLMADLNEPYDVIDYYRAGGASDQTLQEIVDDYI